MATRLNWDYKTMPENDENREGISLRVRYTGRGKSRTAIWQRYIGSHIYIDGVTPDELIEKITQFSHGKDDVRIHNEIGDEYSGDPFISTYLTGWADGVTESEIKQVEDYLASVEDEDERQKRIKREKAERELARIKKEFPDLVNV
jgi:hypothetical protein